jgi:signal transduction histidine kinase
MLSEAAWIALIALVSGLFIVTVSVETYSKTASLVSFHALSPKTNLFIGALDQSMLGITAAEAAERGYRLTGDERYREEFEKTLENNESARQSMASNANPADHDLVTKLDSDMNAREIAMQSAIAGNLESKADDTAGGDGSMLQMRQTADTLRTNALARLGKNADQALILERRASWHLAVSVAIIALMAASIGASFQALAREKMMRRLHMERQNAIAANRTKSSFLAYASHELRTPLNAIIGFSEFMMMEFAGPMTDRQKQYLSDIRGSGLHLQSLISDILDLTKAEAGKITLTEQSIDVPQLIEACTKLVEGQAKEANVMLTSSAPSSLPRLRGDELRCKQILINVAINAIQFTPAGGQVSITARMANDGTMLFIISDTGNGVADDDLPKMIEPYFRSGIDEPSHKGYGLGLPLARKIVELHGGTMTLHSVVGQGTTVTVAMPADRIGETSASIDNVIPLKRPTAS